MCQRHKHSRVKITHLVTKVPTLRVHTKDETSLSIIALQEQRLEVDQVQVEAHQEVQAEEDKN